MIPNHNPIHYHSNLKMKKFLLAACVALTSLFAANHTNAQVKDMLGIANHLGVNLNVGTTGIGVEAATPITPFVQARLGISVMPGINFHVDSEVTIDTNNAQPGVPGSIERDIRLDGSLKRVQGSLIFNVYPLGNRFPLFIAVGGYFGGRDMVKITGKVDDFTPDMYSAASVEIGDYRLPLDPNGNVRGALRVNAFRPYIGIGTGRPCPVGRINFMWELGVQIQGKPYVWDEINKTKVDSKFMEDSDDTFQKVMDHFTVYPVLKFTISGRIF